MTDGHDTDAGFDPGVEPGAGPPDRTLDDLIVRHLDGGLDPDGQRRLAALLAGSADARRTLATYLRLEAALLRLALAGLLGANAVPIEKPASPLQPAAATVHPPPPPSPSMPAGSRPRTSRLRPALLTIAAGLLTAVILAATASRGRLRTDADLDRVADGWLALDHDGVFVSPLRPDASARCEDADADEDGHGVQPAVPPRWLLAAVADDATDAAAPDEG